jgi:sn-glycerol 3-phosphate transport system ATP-binding protein
MIGARGGRKVGARCREGERLAAIELRDVSKVWGPMKAVDRITFSTDEGRLLVLLGPSGCGKSTTLRLIAGLEAVDGGSIRIGGADVTALPPAQRRIAMVFQSYALFPHLSVAENIVFGLRVRKVNAEDRAARLARVADLLGLSALLARKPGQLSGGQQQRVALGRAIIAEQPVYLMDEPLSNLDAQLRAEMRREIRELQQKLGITMVYVTHDQTEAMSMADQVILLKDGRIEQDAAPAEIYERPATVFAARFIGTPPMNIVKLTTLAGGADTVRAALAAFGPETLVGVRPEHIRFAANGDAPKMAASVASVEYLGADSIVDCRLGDEMVTVRVAGQSALLPGERVGIEFEAQALHFFDAATGRRRQDIRAEQTALA